LDEINDQFTKGQGLATTLTSKKIKKPLL